jgi:inner membrane transporter RhtA
VLLGLLVLHHSPSMIQMGGISLVVLAGAAARRGGRRRRQDAARVDAAAPRYPEPVQA